MAPIKFEEQIKDKLEQRHLKPSADAWDRLSEKLDAEESTASSKNWWWLGIAASFMGLLAFTILLNKEPKTIEPATVENPTEINDKTIISGTNVEMVETSSEDKTQKVDNTLVKEEEASVKTAEVSNQNGAPILTPKKEMNAYKDRASEAEVVVENTLLEEQLDKDTQTMTAEDLKVQEVAQRIQQLQNSKKEVTDDEIEALLIEAQKELMLQKSYDKSTNTVDPMALLLEVEFELDKSFRDKVFETLESGYVIVKNAVIDRDN